MTLKPSFGELQRSLRVERRSFVRVPVCARMVVGAGDHGPEEQTRTLNISGGGISFMSAIRHDPGTALHVEVHPAEMPMVAHQFESLRARLCVLRVEGGVPPYRIASEFLTVR